MCQLHIWTFISETIGARLRKALGRATRKWERRGGKNRSAKAAERDQECLVTVVQPGSAAGGGLVTRPRGL